MKFINYKNDNLDESSFESIQNEDIINNIYNARSYQIDNLLKDIDKNLKKKLKDINIDYIIEHDNNIEVLRDTLKKMEDNENIKITEYNKGLYKLGFKDGVNLILNCLKK